MLIQGLPPDAATFRKAHFPPATELAAQLIEHVDEWGRTWLARMNAQPGQKYPVPAPPQIVRPGEEPPEPKKQVVSGSEAAAWFASKFAGHASR